MSTAFGRAGSPLPDRAAPAASLFRASPPAPTLVTIRAPATALAFARATAYAPARTPVVIVGDTGTGKSFLAEYIHRASPYRAGPFVDRTAAEITEHLGAAQLFGYERGAFTGAHERRQGLFAEATGGTLLLDDLHLMPPCIQGLLLRALSRGVYRPLGAARDCPVCCRLIVALREGPDALQARGALLPDLRYRLGRCVIRLPALAERREEIGPFAETFLRGCPDETGVSGPTRFAPDVVPALAQARWPGNLRDLKAAVQCAFLHASGDREVRLAHFDDDVAREAIGSGFRRHGEPEANRRAVTIALDLARGSQTGAAHLLGVNRMTVRRYTPRSGEASPEK